MGRARGTIGNDLVAPCHGRYSTSGRKVRRTPQGERDLPRRLTPILGPYKDLCPFWALKGRMPILGLEEALRPNWAPAETHPSQALPHLLPLRQSEGFPPPPTTPSASLSFPAANSRSRDEEQLSWGGWGFGGPDYRQRMRPPQKGEARGRTKEQRARGPRLEEKQQKKKKKKNDEASTGEKKKKKGGGNGE